VVHTGFLRVAGPLAAVALVTAGCGFIKPSGHDVERDHSPAHTAVFANGVELSDPADKIRLTAPAGTEQVTDPTQMADLETGIANSGPPDSRLKLLAMKKNPHSYYPSAIEVYVMPTSEDATALAREYPQLQQTLAGRGGYDFRRRDLTVDGVDAERIDYLVKTDTEPRQITRLLIIRDGKSDLVVIGTDGTRPEPGLADGVVASIVLG